MWPNDARRPPFPRPAVCPFSQHPCCMPATRSSSARRGAGASSMHTCPGPSWTTALTARWWPSTRCAAWVCCKDPLGTRCSPVSSRSTRAAICRALALLLAGRAGDASSPHPREPEERQRPRLVHGHRHQPTDHAADNLLCRDGDQVCNRTPATAHQIWTLQCPDLLRNVACCALVWLCPPPPKTHQCRAVQVGVSWQKAVKNGWKVR